MTAWTSIVIPLWIIARCAIDFIGMEYGSDHQYVSDNGMYCVLLGITLWSCVVDSMNIHRQKTRREN